MDSTQYHQEQQEAKRLQGRGIGSNPDLGFAKDAAYEFLKNLIYEMLQG